MNKSFATIILKEENLKTATIILEAVASYNLWIGHVFFGLPDSLNNINILNQSFLFKDLADRQGPEIEYRVNGNKYMMRYYLTDSIYPSYTAFIKSFNDHQTAKKKGVNREVVIKDRLEIESVLAEVPRLIPRSEILFPNRTFASCLQRNIRIWDQKQHFSLRQNVIDSLWKIEGER
ncbi:hypothetical protein PHYBLDRAFT_174518 [Phycomyces blakesleeanus NRRL 1555(-)]|uniref:Uncharacterized protein n=1 Tax=Phycomyces blakesleeanus (strain ATCC 8743b / DSM 1359 / FGSC 10004 / NBRC 33097 / NRRL 1555) TaxID=763407 RepID=A0A162WHF5_PHYB8|nr:hypothetical protein PHYBLDRAFT_174518 [Phycomyces blakesleeanus NRRL 1555(-)]OAD67135.1 hypothetical protein PHYBLDRAFT_174518 [Phycomyces blakesleeanus NRRL 1555(-)]|eukprot:XP_018285175.1 hypothetical protein PHYBLDRAFT_174518 [Phycomyces blakesleeanus NRRL 1555(-)]